MKNAQTTPIFLLILCAVALSGCHRVKPVVLLPQQPPASTNGEPAGQSQPTTTTPTQADQQPPAATTQDQQAATADNSAAKPGRSKPKHHASTAQKPTPQLANGKPPVEVAK